MTRSVYLTAEENYALEELARLNGLPVNLVLRLALQRLLGRATVELTPLPASPAIGARFGDGR